MTATQFLGAFNDNLFKNALMISIVYRSATLAGMDSQTVVAISAGDCPGSPGSPNLMPGRTHISVIFFTSSCMLLTLSPIVSLALWLTGTADRSRNQ